MPRFIGCDVHRRQITVCILGESGPVVGRYRIACTREAIVHFARRHLECTDHLVLEATTHTWALVELLKPFVARVVVSNPMRTRVIAAAKVKTDRIDAQVLAELLRAGYLPVVWQPDPAIRRLRSLTHRRAGLVNDRTGIKNRIHATLAARLIPVPWAKLFGLQGRAWLAELDLDPEGQQALESDLRLLAALDAEIQALDDRLAALAYPEESVRLLMTLRGIDFTVAQGMVAAWGPVERCPDADRAAAYLGLAPSTRQSDRHCYHGPITKQGSAHARALLIRAAQHLDKNPGPLGAAFRRLLKKKNRNVAVVALARKMAIIAYHLLRNREPYRYALPESTRAKLVRLRVRATGKRRRTSTSKGTPRSDNYGTGHSVVNVPSLRQLCETEELPLPTSPEDLPAGELHHLARTETLEHLQQIQIPRQRLRRSWMPEKDRA